MKWQQSFWQHWEVTSRCIGDTIQLVVMQSIEIIYLNQINVVENIPIGMHQKYIRKLGTYYMNHRLWSIAYRLLYGLYYIDYILWPMEYLFWYNKDFHIILTKNSVVVVSSSIPITLNAVQLAARSVDLENVKYCV